MLSSSATTAVCSAAARGIASRAGGGGCVVPTSVVKKSAACYYAPRGRVLRSPSSSSSSVLLTSSNSSRTTTSSRFLHILSSRQSQLRPDVPPLSTTTTVVGTSGDIIGGVNINGGGTSCSSSVTRRTGLSPPHSHHRQYVRHGRTVRIILLDDLPSGKGYKGDVVHVRAGYARNCLIPGKKALYAMEENFDRLGMKDPDKLTDEEKKQLKAASEDDAKKSEDKKAADILRKYLSNKVLKLYRNADGITGMTSPGKVTSDNIREKLSKQLQIDLDPHEKVTLFPEVVSMEAMEADDVERYLTRRLARMNIKRTDVDDDDEDGAAAAGEETSTTTSDDNNEGNTAVVENLSDVEVKRLGEFLACIHLAGDFHVPLRVAVLRR